MNPDQWPSTIARLLVVVLAMLMLTANASAEWNEKVLYSFQGIPGGATPVGGVVFDKAGNLYGATYEGGSTCLPQGCGTVFQVSPPNQKGGAWTGTPIYSFQGAFDGLSDGLTPQGGLIIDQRGNLYGTTSLGGNGGCVLLGSTVGCGTVYELSPPMQKGGQWTETILYNFKGGKDGYYPRGDLVFDKHGNLHGATQFGGGRGSTCNFYYGGNCGTVFKLSPPKQKGGAWTEQILYSFAGANGQVGDGANPNGGLIFDSKGRIYGTTYYGGNNQRGKCEGGDGGTGCGTVFALTPPSKKGGSWKEKLLHLFRGLPDGSNPAAGVTFGGNGDLYGTTMWGGMEGTGGTVFEVKQAARKAQGWTEAVLYRFTDKNDGANPTGALVFGADGYVYGTATTDSEGGSVAGDVFRLKPPARNGGVWALSVLHGFTGVPDGMFPATNVIFDKHGSLYSTTQQGGTGTGCSGGCGTVFEVSP